MLEFENRLYSDGECCKTVSGEDSKRLFSISMGTVLLIGTDVGYLMGVLAFEFEMSACRLSIAASSSGCAGLAPLMVEARFCVPFTMRSVELIDGVGSA